MPQNLSINDVVEFANRDNIYTGSIIADVKTGPDGGHCFRVQSRHVKVHGANSAVDLLCVDYPASALILKQTPVVCDDDSLHLHQGAGIFGSSQFQWDEKKASHDYTDIANRGAACKQVSGFEDGFVMVGKHLMPARIVDVDNATNMTTILLQNKTPPEAPRSWYDPPTQVESGSVLFRCTQDPNSVLLTADVMKELQKTEHYMSYNDIVQAVKKPTKYFQRSSPLDLTGNPPPDAFTVGNFDLQFGPAAGSNGTEYKFDKARCFGEEVVNLAEKTPVTSLEEAAKLVLGVSLYEINIHDKTATIGCPGGFRMVMLLERPNVFLFYIRDTTWNKPGPADLQKFQQMAASVRKDPVISRAKIEADHAQAKKPETGALPRG